MLALQPPARGAALALATALAAACAGPLPLAPPNLADMEEPVPLLQEPDDEAQRRELPGGSFSGLEVADARDTLDALTGQPAGLVVDRVVENSPAAAAGLAVGDLLLEVETPSRSVELAWPSDWRGIELDHGAGTSVLVVFDRGGAEFETELVLSRRVAGAAREEGQRFREEDRVGVVLRTATEVEARSAGLAPGAGAVVVGLSASSPWRDGGARFGDLIRTVDGQVVGHPEALLDAIRRAESDQRLRLELTRQGTELAVEVPVSRRVRVLRDVSVPLLFDYERDDQRRTWSMLIGLVRWESTPVAWNLRLLWLINLGAGETDRLEEVDS